MIGFIYMIALFLFYIIQRRICCKTILSKKLIIPLICFFLSFAGSIYIGDRISNHGNGLVSFPSDKNAIISQTYDSESISSYNVTSKSKVIASIDISKKQVNKEDYIKIFLFLNVPTLLFTIFIFTGKRKKFKFDNNF